MSDIMYYTIIINQKIHLIFWYCHFNIGIEFGYSKDGVSDISHEYFDRLSIKL